MSYIEDFKGYTLDLFLGEATRQVIEEKKRVYCDILISYPNVFDSLSKIFEYYSDRKRSHWTVTISQCGEDDFYLVVFSPKEMYLIKENPIFFFWKIIRDDKYVTILSFSLQSYSETHRSLDSLVRFINGLWFAWAGSRFLENFDLFVNRVLGEDAKTLASFQTGIERGEILDIKMRIYPLPPKKFLPLEDIRNWAHNLYLKEEKIQTFSNMRYRIISVKKGMYFTFSMTDRLRISFEKGDFTLFVTLLRPLLIENRRILDFLRRDIYTTKRESTIFGKSIEIRSYDLIESLVFRKLKETKNWYNKIVNIFSSDIPEKKLVNFTLLSGNPYFLVHIIDIENSSSVYLSATSKDLHIVPADARTKEAIMAKIIGILQTKVEPSISF